MRKFGKTIKIFLVDGEPNGRMTCELSNWTGKAIKIPRNRVKESRDRRELDGTGIYILFGKSDKSQTRSAAYIGEAEGLYNRLNQHLSSKDFWNEALVVVSKDENLNKAHIKYLESRLHEIATNVDRYEILNGNLPTRSIISESDSAEMEEFIDNVKLLVNSLGYKIFDDLRKAQTSEELKNNTFYIQAPRGANAMGQMTNEGFLVLKDSQIAGSTTNSFPKAMHNLRMQLIEDSLVVNRNQRFIFSQDYLFSSPSAAAAIVMGRSANGLTEWKLSDGRILKAVESES